MTVRDQIYPSERRRARAFSRPPVSQDLALMPWVERNVHPPPVRHLERTLEQRVDALVDVEQQRRLEELRENARREMERESRREDWERQIRASDATEERLRTIHEWEGAKEAERRRREAEEARVRRKVKDEDRERKEKEERQWNE